VEPPIVSKAGSHRKCYAGHPVKMFARVSQFNFFSRLFETLAERVNLKRFILSA